MIKTISAVQSLKLFVCCSSMLLLFLLTMVPINGNNTAWGGDEADMAQDMLVEHMDIMVQQYPELYGNVQEIQEKLGNGLISPNEACSNCHTQDDNGVPPGP